MARPASPPVPKIVHFDRVEWHVQPDPATKAAAMQAGEMDWWENPSADLLPVLRKANIQTPITDHTGAPYLLRPNHLYPPFDKPAVRRALMGAIDQKEFMTAMMGEDTSLWSAPCGFFPPISPLASDAGMSALTGKRDYAAVKKALETAGYQGEKVVLMGATDQPTNYPLAEVAADMLKRVGMNVDYQATDWGTRGAAARADQAAGRGRLESVLHRLLRARLLHAGQPSAAARQRQGRVVRLADRCRRSRRCGMPGSTRRTLRRRRRSARRSSFRHSITSRTIRWGWRSCQPRSARTSPVCRRAS